MEEFEEGDGDGGDGGGVGGGGIRETIQHLSCSSS